MNRIANRKLLWGALAGFLIIGAAAISLSQNKKEYVGNERLCRTMLSHGQEAYEKGLYEKAGYYFLQAVQADSTGMARKWFEQSAGTEEQDAVTPEPEVIKPEPEVIRPDVKVPKVIIGDDEGC